MRFLIFIIIIILFFLPFCLFVFFVFGGGCSIPPPPHDRRAARPGAVGGFALALQQEGDRVTFSVELDTGRADPGLTALGSLVDDGEAGGVLTQ